MNLLDLLLFRNLNVRNVRPSAAQLETLPHGRERLAQKCKQEREIKTKKTNNQKPIDIEKKYDDYINKLIETCKKINHDLNSNVKCVHVQTETKKNFRP